MKENALKKTQSMHGPYKLVIANQLSALREMSAWLEQGLRDLGVPEEVIFNFDLCANEAVANIISYAFPQSGAHQIVLQLSLQDAALSLEIEDDGIPFNPLQRPAHTQPASLEEAEIGGLGIDLIRSFMDECHYTRPHDRNQLKLVAHVGSQP